MKPGALLWVWAQGSGGAAESSASLCLVSQDPAPIIEKFPQLLAMKRETKTPSTTVSRRNL